MMGIESVELNALTDHLKDERDITALYLFGSQSEGGAREDSDVDVAVLLSAGIDRSRYSDYRMRYLSDWTDFFRGTLDLVILNQVPPLLQFQILKHGRLIVDRDPDQRAALEMKYLSRYYRSKRFYDFHFDRLMQRIEKEGLGYGARSHRDSSSSAEAGRVSAKLEALSESQPS